MTSGGRPGDAWLRRQARVLVHELARSGWTMPLGAAAEIVDDRVRNAVEQSGLPEEHVRGLLQPEHVRAMATAIVAELGPGAPPSDGGTARLGGPLGPTFRATG